MRNPEIATRLQNALQQKGWTVRDLHKRIARKTKQGERPAYETLRRWVSEGGGRIHSDVKPDLERAAQALGFRSLDDLVTDPIVKQLQESGELQDVIVNFLTSHYGRGYNTEQGATDFLAIPQCQEKVAELRREGKTPKQIFDELLPSIKRVFRHLEKPQNAPGTKPIQIETQNPSTPTTHTPPIERMVADELLKQVKANLEISPADWQNKIWTLTPSGVQKFVRGLVRELG